MDIKKKSRKYTEEQLKFLRSGYLSMKISDLTRAFNRQFSASKTEEQIKSTLQNHRIRCGRKPKDRLISRLRLYTEEQAEFIQENYAGRSAAEMTDLFNARFGVSCSRQQIKTFVGNRGITSGRTGHFPKGHKPWNCGTKGQGLTGPNRGSFKKGNTPANRKPLWSERVCTKDGFISIKIPERNPYTGFPTRYKHKHVYIWEQAHGPVPQGMVVAFIDGDNKNCELRNLMLISRAELLILNMLAYKDAASEVKPHILAVAKLRMKIQEAQKRSDTARG